MTTEAKGKTPTRLQTNTSLAESALAKLRAANEAAQKASQKEPKPDSGFSPQAAGFSAQQWAALSPDAKMVVANRWLEARRAELKKAKAKAHADSQS